MNTEKFVNKIPYEVKQLLREIEEKSEGYNVYLAGGYLRDLYHEIVAYGWSDRTFDVMFTPKDIDIIFIPRFGAKEFTLPTIERSYVNYDKPAEDISQDMAARGVTQLRGLFVPKLITSDVQFIVYGKHMTRQEVAADMDCGINQVVWNESEGWYNTEAFENDHSNKVIRMYHTFDEERMKKRLFRMHTKFPEYTVDSELDWGSLADEDDKEHTGSMC